MPLPVVETLVTRFLPRSALLPAALAIVALALIHTYARGRSNTRLRDMHGRVVLVTGGLTPLGLETVRVLAEQGAQLVLLLPTLSSQSAQTLIELLRLSTSNPNIHAAECDLSSPASIRAFVAQFMTTAPGYGSAEVARLDAVVLCHEGMHLGAVGASREERDEEEKRRMKGTLGSFLLTTLLLPLMLRAPPTRDIRIVRVINPFYAAALPGFPVSLLASPTSPIPAKPLSIWQQEGARSLRSIVLARHLQRVLDALVPAPPEGEMLEKRRSNILSIAVCPGFSRANTVAPYLRAARDAPGFTVLGLVVYILLYPLLFLLTKSPSSASQSLLFALFAPTSGAEQIRGGELYRECRIVQAREAGWEWGGKGVGRGVWEGLEGEMKKWEEKGVREEEKEKEKEEGKAKLA